MLQRGIDGKTSRDVCFHKYLGTPLVERTLEDVLSTHFPRDIAKNMIASKCYIILEVMEKEKLLRKR